MEYIICILLIDCSVKSVLSPSLSQVQLCKGYLFIRRLIASKFCYLVALFYGIYLISDTVHKMERKQSGFLA